MWRLMRKTLIAAYHYYITIEGKLNLFDHYLFRASFNSAAYFVDYVFVDAESSRLFPVHNYTVQHGRFGIRRRRGSGLLLETEGFCDPLGMKLPEKIDKIGVLQLGRI